MAVSASCTCANWTTPQPFDRVPSYKISASSTWPVVSNSSTRSSFAVDHGNCPRAGHHQHLCAFSRPTKRATYVSDHDLLRRLCLEATIASRTAIRSIAVPGTA